MINDVLEQLAEDYFRHLGYFTQHNVKYKPNLPGHAYAVHSDIDIIAINPKLKGINRVAVVSCKSWHGGLHIERDVRRIEQNYNKSRKTYREVAIPAWSKALINKVKALTGQKRFVFYVVCNSYDENKRQVWVKNKFFMKNLNGCKIELLSMKEMVSVVWKTASFITPAHSELSRLLQLVHHSGGSLSY